MDVRQFFLDVLKKNDFLASEYIKHSISPSDHLCNIIPCFQNLAELCEEFLEKPANPAYELQDFSEFITALQKQDITGAARILQYYKTFENFFVELESLKINELSTVSQQNAEQYEDLDEYQFEDGRIRDIHLTDQSISLHIDGILIYYENGPAIADIIFHLYGVHTFYISPHLMQDKMIWYFHITREGELHKLVIATHTGYLQISAESYGTEILKIL